MDTGDTNQFNRYMYGNNDPINMFDPDGMDSVHRKKHAESARRNIAKAKARRAQRSGARSDFRRNYQDMRDTKVIGADKFFHCKANREATRRGPEGEAEAERISDLREAIDQSPIPFI